MGKYLKVVGNLVMITSDLDHTFCRILPADQQIIPVSLKRKLSYEGYYIEEWVDSRKISMYFAWFKENNPFFYDVMFDIESMDKNAQDIAENIEKYLATGHEIVKEEKESDGDDENIFTNKILDGVESLHVDKDTHTVSYDSALMNKYGAEIEEESPMYQFAQLIVNYEISMDIEHKHIEDLETELLEVKDEVVDEKVDSAADEQYMQNSTTNMELSPEQIRKVASGYIEKINKKMEKKS